jgi:hypothetical protein
VCTDLQSRISKGLSLLRVAACCTVLRSRWYQSGIKFAPTSASFCDLLTSSCESTLGKLQAETFSEVRPPIREHFLLLETTLSA